MLIDLYYIGTWLKAKGKVSEAKGNITGDYHVVDTNTNNYTLGIDNIGTTTYTQAKNCFLNDHFNGKADMIKYIKAANEILRDVYNSGN
nr:MAG TPA: hypothetical protein [Crassvirales sp.]